MTEPHAPKLAIKGLHRISIRPASNGAVVTHHFHNAVPSRSFVFHDPATMRAHLTRALRSQWRHPGVDLGGRIDATLND